MTINAISKSAIIQPGADGGLYSFQRSGGIVSSLTATPQGSDSVLLSWQEDISTEDGFRIYRGTTTATLAIIGSTGPNIHSYYDTNLSAGQSFWYKVVAQTAGTEFGGAFVLGAAGDAYVPTVTVTTQAELNTAITNATSGTVIGVVYNATSYTLSESQLNGRSFNPGGLVICTSGGTAAKFRYAYVGSVTNLTLYGLEITDSSPTAAFGLVEIANNAHYVTVKNCTIHGKYYDPAGDYSGGGPTNYNGVLSNTSAATNLSFIDNTIYDVKEGIVAGCGGHQNIVGNTIYNMYEDAIKIPYHGQSVTRVNWNTLYGGYASSADPNDPHCDLIQFLPSSPFADWTGIEILGNIGFVGDVPDGIVQGIFLQGLAGTGKYFTATIKGNLMCAYTQFLQVDAARDCIVIGNTVVPGNITDSLTAQIYLDTDPAGEQTVKNNVAYGVNGGTQTNNYTYTPTQTAAKFLTLFDGPTFTKAALNSRAAVLTAFSMKVAGPLDTTTNIGAVGSGYVDFDARTLNGAME